MPQDERTRAAFELRYAQEWVKNTETMKTANELVEVLKGWRVGDAYRAGAETLNAAWVSYQWAVESERTRQMLGEQADGTVIQVEPSESAPNPNNCVECANADSWGLPVKPCCRSCVSGNNWEPLNKSSVNPNNHSKRGAA